jgi:hypothetical protein
MAIKVSGTTVIDDSRALQNITDVNPLIKKPTITAPSNGATEFMAGTPIATIEVDGFAGLFTSQASLTVQIDNNSDFSSPIVDETVTSTTDNSVEIAVGSSNIPNSTVIYIRARYADGDGTNSDWSDTISVTSAALYSYVNAPSITTAPSGEVATETFQFQASTISVQNGTDTHFSTDWQVATDANFTNIVQQSLNDQTDKTLWTNTTSFPNSSTIYVRVRYKGTTLGYSSYSSTISFTTPSSWPGDYSYTTPGTYTFSSNQNIQASVLVIGGGGGGTTQHDNSGASGGALAWSNSISLATGTNYTITVGSGGAGKASTGSPGSSGGQSIFDSTSTLYANGGVGAVGNTNPGAHSRSTFGGPTASGGQGGGGTGGSRNGSGGAGGYSGNGGNGATSTDNGDAETGQGGGGGGSFNQNNVGCAGGGGVGIFGQGTDGLGGTTLSSPNGKGGSGGTDAAVPAMTSSSMNANPNGGVYGGAGGSRGIYGSYGASRGGDGGGGAVRVMWGNGRSFPSNAGEL